MEREVELSHEVCAALYALLARCFEYPAQGFCESLRAGAVDLCRRGGDGELRDALERLSIGAEDALGLPLERLQAEHTRLFITGYPRFTCQPYASVYAEGALRGDLCAGLSALYAEWGVGVADVPPDHIGAELEFMAYLVRLALDPDGEDTVATQGRFVEESLACWAPAFARDVERESRLALYEAAARLLSVLMSREVEKHAQRPRARLDMICRG